MCRRWHATRTSQAEHATRASRDTGAAHQPCRCSAVHCDCAVRSLLQPAVQSLMLAPSLRQSVPSAKGVPRISQSAYCDIPADTGFNGTRFRDA